MKSGELGFFTHGRSRREETPPPTVVPTHFALKHLDNINLPPIYANHPSFRFPRKIFSYILRIGERFCCLSLLLKNFPTISKSEEDVLWLCRGSRVRIMGELKRFYTEGSNAKTST